MSSASHLPTRDPSPAHPQGAGKRPLVLATKAWFVATFIGQLLFATFVLLYYYPPTLSGNFAAWNNKPLITGHVAGDSLGNSQFALHVLVAAVMTLLGLVQLVPAIRSRWPIVHRWSGRLFLLAATILSLGGLWLVWVRGTYLSLNGAAAITLDGLLIMGFAAMAWSTARSRQFAAHRRWALRTFIVASGVWFMRVGYIAWALPTHGAGIAKGMSGPFDLFWGWATYLLPLAVLELYFRAERASLRAQRAMATGLWLGALVILGGSLGAWFAMWWPYL